MSKFRKLYRKLYRKKFLCGVLGWHSPTKQITFYGINIMSICRYCGKPIALDSQGNWFELWNRGENDGGGA